MSSGALAAAAALGPFFVLETDPPPRSSADGGPPWRAFTELTDDPAVTRARIAAIRGAIAERGRLSVDDVPQRAAASLAHLGLVSRLISPSLGAAVLGGVVPDLDGLWWRDVLGPVPLTLPDPRGEVVDAGDAEAVAAVLARQFVHGPVARLTAAIGAEGKVSARVLWGNVASAAAGSVRMLGSASPAHAEIAFAVGRHLVDQAPLIGLGAFTGTAFRRSTCCLYYKIPGGGYCGDCVLEGR
ncbi:(2Fe-2S)-binding protein [Sporichthya sp.]|uniref:(2Fe-2S)-binding protein n=1 Tax=Sporichthya sp. TaxID=65475 RepID=UPI0017C79BBE|nr:(2Fe-2S)-binding protein [Sporichthya sp.]MBA3744127.1 (2Fe-2S)-binding protein [Sporichthya sp.]